jgi:hypothetical protein
LNRRDSGYPHRIGMEDAKYPCRRAAALRPPDHPDVMRSLVRLVQGMRHTGMSALIDTEGLGMTKLVMMWMFGVPVSVLLLFMFFGVI